MSLHKLFQIVGLFSALIFFGINLFAQQTNPVERQVANPLTDTPNINPVAADTEIKAPSRKKTVVQEGGDGELVVYSANQTVTGKEGNRIVAHTGNVDARYGIYRMQADKLTVQREQWQQFSQD